ncbi:MAG: hypothetical protein LUH03_09725 [Oscillospiraceae bacterium]|nr:hypothetical protein [Oscillospiraceae bacterium]
MLSTKTLRAAIVALIFDTVDVDCCVTDEKFTTLRELFNEYENVQLQEEYRARRNANSNDKLDV